MSDTSQDDGWWQANNGKWYPPESHPDHVASEEAAPERSGRRSEQPGSERAVRGQTVPPVRPVPPERAVPVPPVPRSSDPVGSLPGRADDEWWMTPPAGSGSTAPRSPAGTGATSSSATAAWIVVVVILVALLAGLTVAVIAVIRATEDTGASGPVAPVVLDVSVAMG